MAEMADSGNRKAVLAQGRGRKVFVFGKKEAKNACPLGGGFRGAIWFGGRRVDRFAVSMSGLSSLAARPRIKRFLLLYFSKKKMLPSCHLPPSAPSSFTLAGRAPVAQLVRAGRS
jgi:hypothetical protein